MIHEKSARARVIVVGNETAGSGKSTIAIHIAVGEAGEDPAVASLRLQGFLALEIPEAGRAAEDRSWLA